MLFSETERGVKWCQLEEMGGGCWATCDSRQWRSLSPLEPRSSHLLPPLLSLWWQSAVWPGCQERSACDTSDVWLETLTVPWREILLKALAPQL